MFWDKNDWRKYASYLQGSNFHFFQKKSFLLTDKQYMCIHIYYVCCRCRELIDISPMFDVLKMCEEIEFLYYSSQHVRRRFEILIRCNNSIHFITFNMFVIVCITNMIWHIGVSWEFADLYLLYGIPLGN